MPQPILRPLKSKASQSFLAAGIQGEKFYPSAADALSDAEDLIIIVCGRESMSAEEFRTLITAMDASLVEGRDS
jgi:hypothetical protein